MERTPLAVLASALTEQSAHEHQPSHAQPADWAALKNKRKRTVACGQCDACCRDDCGSCLNCLDKPKFGGSGIRKQSCLERKCRQPTAAPTPLGATPASKLFAPPPATSEARKNMQPEEWDDFWNAVECCMLLQGGATPSSAMLEERHGGGKRGRTNRCGACAGCVRGDCGACKNCKDKPKFGGKGIKKQACVRRVCSNPQPDAPEGSDDENDGW